MNRGLNVLLLLLAVVFGVGAIVALAGSPAIRDPWADIGVSYGLGTLIGVLELAGAAGLLLGLRWRPLAVAAACSLTALMIGAVTYHVRADDTAGAAPPAVLGVVAAALAWRSLRRPARP